MKGFETRLLAAFTALALVLAVSVPAVAQDEGGNLEEELLAETGFYVPSSYLLDDFDCSYDEDRDDDGVVDVEDADDDNDGIPDAEDWDDDNDGINDLDDPVDDLSCSAEFELPDSSSGDADVDVDVDVDLDDDGVVDLDDDDDDNDGVVDLDDDDDNNDGIVDIF